MKTAIVISDTHRNFSALEKLLPKMLENDYVFHLGDNDGDILSYRKEQRQVSREEEEYYLRGSPLST